jgi:hypothetical protein
MPDPGHDDEPGPVDRRGGAPRADLLAPASPAQVSPSEAAAEPADHYRDILARILSGLLGS